MLMGVLYTHVYYNFVHVTQRGFLHCLFGYIGFLRPQKADKQKGNPRFLLVTFVTTNPPTAKSPNLIYKDNRFRHCLCLCV